MRETAQYCVDILLVPHPDRKGVFGTRSNAVPGLILAGDESLLRITIPYVLGELLKRKKFRKPGG